MGKLHLPEPIALRDPRRDYSPPPGTERPMTVEEWRAWSETVVAAAVRLRKIANRAASDAYISLLSAELTRIIADEIHG